MKTIAVDFETANEKRGSACAIGLAWIEDRRVVRREERLIRPKEMRFAGINIAIHGIRPEDVEHEKEFPDVLDEFLPEISGGVVLAHNAAFDMSVLRATLDKYDLKYPEFHYLCTAKISRKVWPDLVTTSLHEVAFRLGIEFQHHRAISDAYACGEVALAAMRKLGVTEIAEVPQRINMTTGKLWADGYEPCSTGIWGEHARPSKVTPTAFDWSEEHPLFRRSVVFTGGLRLMSRLEAAQMVVNAGGIVHDRVKRDTNVLVIAGDDYDAIRRLGKMSSKTRRATELIAQGAQIEVLTEDEFYQFL